MVGGLSGGEMVVRGGNGAGDEDVGRANVRETLRRVAEKGGGRPRGGRVADGWRDEEGMKGEAKGLRLLWEDRLRKEEILVMRTADCVDAGDQGIMGL